MKAITRKLRSPLKTHGGKSYLARRIIALMPPHRVYVEPFLGGGSVLLNKAPAAIEVGADINTPLMYTCISIHDAPLGMRLEAIPYAPESFAEAKRRLSSGEALDSVEAAVWFIVRNRMSRGGLGESFAWSDRLRGGKPGDLNAWETFRDELPRVVERIAGVRLLTRPAVETIGEFDGPDALIYCDPPYMPETRTVRDAYDQEMTADQHAELLETLNRCRGTVLLSGYRSALYDRALAGWTRHEWDMANHSGQGKSKERRVECLWVNRS